VSKITIGVDPDSKAHGIAVYVEGELVDLMSMPLMKIITHFDWQAWDDVTVHIEDVCANNAVFMPPSRSKSKIAEAKARGRTLGKCQQAQIELERFFEYAGVKVVKHKISSAWKKDKAQFEKVTGWCGRSNEDTRSAAWFGYLGLRGK
tara:strand:- start:82 stop:525 length:444 start_codon:yes stop_codon:yes gene_type:complete